MIINRIINSKFLKCYIPGVEICLQEEKSDCELIIKKNKPKIELKYPKAVYNNNVFDEKDIISLIEYLLERSRQESGLYCIHGSACLIKGKAVIFWGGASGMGKTTLCEKLQEEYGANWFADEKIVINFSTGKVISWVDRAYLKTDKGNFKKLDSKIIEPIPIAFFVYPILSHQSCNKMIFDKWPKSKFRWHLFEELNRKIRATSRLFFSNNEPIMPLDTMDLARKRLSDLKKAINSFKCYFLSGNYKDICKKICSII